MPTGTLSPIFQFAIANRVFNYNEHNGSRHQPPLSRPIFPSPSSPPSPLCPVEPLFLCKRPVQPGMASGWIIPLLSHPLPQHGPSPPLRAQPPSFAHREIFRFHDNNCRSISLRLSFSLSYSLLLFLSNERAIASLRSFSFSFSLSLISRAKNCSDNRSSIANDKHFMPADALYPKYPPCFI